MKERFKVGDTAWVANFNPNAPVNVPCGVCYGTKKVTLILGNGDSVELPCGYCSKGYEDPTGYEVEYHPVSEPKRIYIDGVTVETIGETETVEYQEGSQYRGYRVYHEEKVFATKEEAQAAGEKLMAEWLKERRTNAFYIKADVKKNFAWNAGYHIRQVKEMEHKIEYHREKAKLCKERAK